MDIQHIPLHIGAERPFRSLLIADTHLLFSDGRDCRAKYDVTMRRIGEYVFKNVGRNVPYFLEALLECKRNGYLLLHCGDLLDFYSPANLEVAERLLALSGVEYFLCAGNHEYTNYSGQYPETAEEMREAREKVPAIFRNDINYGSKVVHGVNFIALYNGEGSFDQKSVEFFDEQAAKGLPMVLLVHVPVYTPETRRFLREDEGSSFEFLLGAPHTRPMDEPTAALYHRICHHPLLKVVLSGHVHSHANIASEIAPGKTQVLVGGAYYGCSALLEFD